MQKRKKINIATAMCMAATLALSLPVYADNTQEQIDSLTEQSNETKSNLVSAEERIAALETQKGDTQAYLTELSNQLTELSQEREALEQQYEEKQAELLNAQEELEQAKEEEESQYQEMKLRIQYIYEESVNAGMLEAIFSADSFTDFLNRAEAMSQINQYDRKMLEAYGNAVTEVENKEAQLKEEQENIAALKEEQEQQQENTQAVYESSYREFEACVASLSDTQGQQAQLIAQIQAQDEQMNQLLVQKYAEEAAQQEAARQAAQQAAANTIVNESSEAEQTEAASQAEQEESQVQQSQSQQEQPQQSQSDTGNSSQESGSQESSLQNNTQENQSGGNLSYLGNFTLTAYCSCEKCCGKWAAYAGSTASGAKATQGVTVAMGGVPFGTQLSINGHIYTVQDRGTAYGHVDIYFSNHADASAFGLQHADVYQVN